MTDAVRMTRDDLLRVVWGAGDLSYQMHSMQVEARELFYRFDGRILPLLWTRRGGKSRLAETLAVECAVTTPNARCRIASSTQKDVKNIVEPHMAFIHADAPEEFQPRYFRQDGVWEYPNGAQIQAAGCDNGNMERLRGTEMHLGVVEEAGFIDGLRYLVQDVLLPQTITTGGKIIMPTSPPRSPSHDLVGYLVEAEAAGRLMRRTIYDAPHITPELIEEFKRESGGEDSTTWRREYLCEIIVDEGRAVVPEFSAHERHVVGEVERPGYYDAYVAGDFGFHDLTVLLFAYWHFEAAKLVIEDELVFQRTNSGTIIPAAVAKERELWGGKRPLVRVGDMDALARADINVQHGYGIGEVRKHDAESALNTLRLAVQKHDILIHPRCKTLIAHLRNAIWNKGRTSYERSGEYGHFDAVDALKYLLRHVNRGKNPHPQWGADVRPETHFIPDVKPSSGHQALTALASGALRRHRR